MVGVAAPETFREASVERGVRAPVQQRSRERWANVLDAGVELIEEGGYEALTIAAVCDRAGVPPRLIYERVASKDVLFLAVYEHGMQRVVAAEAGLDDEARWTGLTPAEVVAAAVREVASVFAGNRRFLRSIVLISSEHAEIRERGAAYAENLRLRFTDRLHAVNAADHDAIAAVFRTVFAALVFRTAYGDDFLQPRVSDERYVEDLADLARRALGL